MKKCMYVALLILNGCGFFTAHREKTPEIPKDYPIELAQKYTEKSKLLHKAANFETGWPSITDCDATLWAGEACLAGVRDVKITFAEYASGKVERRPYKSCYPDESQSSVSRDMLVGYMACLWHDDDKDGLERLAIYGENHSWAMGEPATRPDLVSMGPSQQGLLGRMLSALDGDEKKYKDIVPIYLPVQKDYERHIQTIQVLVQSDVGLPGFPAHAINGQMLDRLKDNVDNNGKDALFQAALGRFTGDMSEAISLLMDADYKAPSYVRGDDNYTLVHWLYAASVVLTAYKE